MQYEIPKEMKAVVLTAPKQFEIASIPVPMPAEDEVLCQIKAVAICGSDPSIFNGSFAGRPIAYPFIAGHEWAGIVVQAGKRVTQFRPGDRVAGEAHCGCGVCENCMKGKYTICLNYGNRQAGHRHYGFTENGAYAQYGVFKPKSLSLLPDSLTFAEGTMTDTLGVATHGVENAHIESGSTSVIIGPGPIGLCTMRVAKAMGSSRVIMVGRGDRLQFAREGGADEIVDYSKEDPVEAVRRLTNGLGADQVFECSGAAGTVAQAVKMVCRGGTVCAIGMAKPDAVEPIPFQYVCNHEISIIGSKANPNVSARVLRMIASGQVPVKDLITHRFDMEDMATALDVFTGRKDHAVKVVVCPNGIDAAGE